jgi:hypothetical protein
MQPQHVKHATAACEARMQYAAYSMEHVGLCTPPHRLLQEYAKRENTYTKWKATKLQAHPRTTDKQALPARAGQGFASLATAAFRCACFRSSAAGGSGFLFVSGRVLSALLASY